MTLLCSAGLQLQHFPPYWGIDDFVDDSAMAATSSSKTQKKGRHLLVTRRQIRDNQDGKDAQQGGSGGAPAHVELRIRCGHGDGRLLRRLQGPL